MKTLTLMAFAITMTACAVDGTDDVETTVAPSPATASTFSNGGGTDTRTIGDLKSDGYTCAPLEGTSMTMCWKNGGGSYTCNEQGNCIANLTTKPPIRTFPIAPIGTAVLAR